MKKIVFCAAAAVLALAACEKKEIEKPEISGEKVTLTVRVPVVSTKVAGTASETSEKAVSSYQIFVFSRPDGLLESYLETTSSTGELICTTGEKDIVVLANAPDLSGITTLSELKAGRSALSDNKLGAFVMEGHNVESITSDSSVIVNLKKNVAKVRLVKVEAAFEMDAYDASSLTINAVYLIRVAADKSYLSDMGNPSELYSEQVYESNVLCDAFLYDAVSNVEIADGASYTGPHYFYCYPNPNAADTAPDKATRLVVEASVEGATCYYPVSLPAVKSNVVYDVALKITRPGVQNPSDDITQYASDFTINVLDWDETVSVNEII